MRSPHTMGVEPDQAGRSSVHVMFSVFDQRMGSACSALTPFSEGPRHCGQFSAVNARSDTQNRRAASEALVIIFVAHTSDGVRGPSGRSRTFTPFMRLHVHSDR